MSPERLGQHFLADAKWRERIALAIFGLAAHADSSPASGHGPSPTADTAGKLWIEIGAGHGEMTGMIARHAGQVIAIELDPELAGNLRDSVKELPNVSVVNADVLAVDLPGLVDQENANQQARATASSRYHVYGNLPYYITSPIVHRLFEHADRLAAAFVVVQVEVAERMTASPGSRDYGYFSTFTQFYSHPQILLRIPPGAFRPPPQVGSALVALRPPGQREKLGITDESAFLDFLKGCFAQKRKTLRNNLRAMPHGDADIEETLRQVSLAPDARAEQLTLEQFAALFTRWREQTARRTSPT